MAESGSMTEAEWNIWLRESTKVFAAYRAAFGEHSLDGVILHDPLHPDFKAWMSSLRRLRRALKRNEPLPQIPPDDFKNIIF